MKHRPAHIAAVLALLGAALLITYKVASARWSHQAAVEARAVVGRAATALDLKIGDFSGPEIIDPGFFGSNTYEWERRANNRAIERLVYDPFEGNVCWSRAENGNWKHHGCINAK